MNKKKITQEEINKALDFLILLESNAKSGETLKNLPTIAKQHKVMYYSNVTAGMLALKYIRKDGPLITFQLENPEPRHARLLIEKMREQALTYNQQYNKSKKVKKPVEPIIKEKERAEPVVKNPKTVFVVESCKTMMFEGASITLAGYRISGDFSIEEL